MLGKVMRIALMTFTSDDAMLMSKEDFLAWLRPKVEELRERRDHAVSFGNYGKAAELNGQLDGFVRVISKIEMGDFDSPNKLETE